MFKLLNFVGFQKSISNTGECEPSAQLVSEQHQSGTNLLRSSIKASGWQLPLTEPPAQQVGVHLVQLAGERQEAGAAVNLIRWKGKEHCDLWGILRHDSVQEG